MGKTTKIQVLRSNYPIKPPIDMMGDGVIAINNRIHKEKIYFKSEDGNSLVEFDPTETIMSLVDDKIANTNIGHLQEQVDTINGGENVEGSFAHADKVLKESIVSEMNEKVETISAGKGIKVSETVVDNAKSVTIEASVNPNDLVLHVDEISGITATLKLELSGNTVSLIGRNGIVISYVTVPGMNLTFSGTDTVELNNNDGNVYANVKIDSSEDNRLSVSSNGLFSSRIIDCGKY